MNSVRVVCSALIASFVVAASGQVVQPPFNNDYIIVNLGSVPGVPTPYGGLVFRRGFPNRLLIGGSANGPTGAVYSIQVVRGSGQRITGFQGTAELLATAPFIDAGLTYAANGTLFFTQYPNNGIGQILPGLGSPGRITPLGTFGVTPSPGGMTFVPPGNPGAGLLKIATFQTNQWYDIALSEDGNGLFTITGATLRAQTFGGTEGIFYVPVCSPGFFERSVLASEFTAGRISTYEIDGGGNPIAATFRVFISGLTNAEGAAVDPVTGDFLFATFNSQGENRVYVVRGFPSPCPIDFNQDCFVNGVDFDLFVQAFENGTASADFDGDGFITGLDYDLFVQAFEAGC